MTAQMITEFPIQTAVRKRTAPVTILHGIKRDGRIEHFFTRHGIVFRCACGEMRSRVGKVLR